MPRLNASLVQRPPPGNRFRLPNWKIGTSKDAHTSDRTMATVPAAERGGPIFPRVTTRPREPLWEDGPMTLDESVHGMRLRVIERAQVQC